MQNKNIVIGIGNLLFFDDGIGVITLHYLKKNFDFTPELELLDGGTLGFNLAQYFLEYDNVFIIDTLSTHGEVGNVYKIPSKDLLGQNSYKNTAHEVEVLQILEACELYEKKAKVTIFGIVPQNIQSIQIGISEILENNFNVFIQTIIDELNTLGIKSIKKAHYNLDSIIKELRC